MIDIIKELKTAFDIDCIFIVLKFSRKITKLIKRRTSEGIMNFLLIFKTS